MAKLELIGKASNRMAEASVTQSAETFKERGTPGLAPAQARRGLVDGSWPTRQFWFWLIAGGVTLALVLTLRDVLLPFVLGMALAYFLDPVVDRIERIGFGRGFASFLVVMLFALLIVVAVVYLMPLLMQQVSELLSNLPTYLANLRTWAQTLLTSMFGPEVAENILGVNQAFDKYGQQIAGAVASALGSVVSSGLAVLNIAAMVLITPIVTFYLLMDWDRLIVVLDRLLPREHAPTLRRLGGEIDDTLHGYLRGLVLVVVFLAVFYAVGLSMAGLNYGVLVGLVAGLISFVPFIGAVIGFIAGTAMAIAQFGTDWIPVAQVVAVFAVGQFVEGNILQPKVIGDRVRLHPVWLIFALFALSYLLGFLGVLLAVPIAAAIGVLVRYGIEQYLASSFYAGPAAADALDGGGAQPRSADHGS